jgi:hypothetical protein
MKIRILSALFLLIAPMGLQRANATMVIISGARSFDVFVPDSYDPATSEPLEIALSGCNQCGADF